MALSKRVRWVIFAAACLAAFIAVAIWLGGMSIEKRVEDMTAQAEEMGMHVTFGPEVINPETKRLLLKINADVDKLQNDTELPPLDTEDPDELREIAAAAKSIVADAYSLSECGQHLSDDPLGDWMNSLQAFDVLAMDANLALLSRDKEHIIRALTAMRKLAHLLPREHVLLAGLVMIEGSRYFAAIQNAAELMDDPKDIDALFEEMSRWEIDDFDLAASYLPAEAFEGIELNANAPYEGTILERLQQASDSTHLAQTKRKMFALHDAIAVYPEWHKDKYFLEITEDRPLSISDVRHYGHILKTSELELQMFTVAAKAVLLAKKQVVNGKPWPTIDELEAMGLDMTDPVHGEEYVWKEFNGHKRLFGNRYPRLVKDKQDFLLLSFVEQRASYVEPSL